MAGSYEHIKRATKPTDNTAESYGGLDTSHVENMGDAIEAMVHMWWMIQILAKAAHTPGAGVTHRELIKRVSKSALMIEVGRAPVPPDTDFGDDDEDDVSRLDELRAMKREYEDRNTDPEYEPWEQASREEAEELAELEGARKGPLKTMESWGAEKDVARKAAPQPLPTDWTPTMYLRFEKREVPNTSFELNKQPTATIRFILQQGYVHNATAQRMWVDVPTVEEGK